MTVFISGGTSVLDRTRPEIEQPTHLVDIRHLSLKDIEELPRTLSRHARVLALEAPLLLALAATGCSGVSAKPGPVAPAPERYPIIPAPRRLEAKPGEFRLDRETRIMLSDPASTELRTLSELLAAPLRAASGLPLPVSPKHATDHAPHAITIRLAPDSDSREPEGYRLSATERGAILSAHDALYTFYLSSDDGAKLRINGEVVADNGGGKGRGQIALRKGFHPIEVVFFQAPKGAMLRLEGSAPGSSRRPVPATWFHH